LIPIKKRTRGKVGVVNPEEGHRAREFGRGANVGSV
jgi:hypothetical protein